MGVVRAAATFESVTGLSADRIVHDFWFRWDGPIGPSDAEVTDLAEFVVAFYNDDSGAFQSVPLARYLSREVSRAAGASQVRCYRHDDLGAPSGSPQIVLPFTLGAAGTPAVSLPAECAVCLSVNADLTGVQVEVGATRPQSRRRGRTFFGPLNSLALSLGTDGVGVQRPNTTMCDDLRAAYQRLATDASNIMALNAGLYVSVYSQTDVAARTVVSVSTDNAFDTQRRRGSRPTEKTAGVVGPL